MRENFTYGLMRRGWFTPAFHSNRKLYSRGILLINFLNWGFQGGCPPLLQWGDEDVFTVRRGTSPFLVV